MSELDLYARVEDLLGFGEAKKRLYSIFFDEIKSLNLIYGDILDFGCGSGEFLLELSEKFATGFMGRNGDTWRGFRGIDASEEMVARTLANGMPASTRGLDDYIDEFALITATFDVINYLNLYELKQFFDDALHALVRGGYLMFDINTLKGFSLADGVLHETDGQNHIIIDANFDQNVLTTQMIYFEKSGVNYIKHQNAIKQYYHSAKEILNLSPLTHIKTRAINLYENGDKEILVFQKSPK